MSRFNSKAEQSPEEKIHTSLEQHLRNAGTNMVHADIALESFSIEQYASTDEKAISSQRVYDNISAELRNTALGTEFLDKMALECYTEAGSAAATSALNSEMLADSKDLAMEMATLTVMAAGNPLKQVQLYLDKAQGDKDTTLVTNGLYESNYVDQYSLESFELATVQTYLPIAIMINAQLLTAGAFADVWFTTKVLSVGQAGADVRIRMPQIFTPVTRSTDGTPSTWERTALIKAIVNPELLDDDHTVVLPYAASDTLPASLVPASVIPTENLKVGTVTVPFRPIAFSPEPVDMIALSSAPGLLKNGAFNETDALDHYVNMGTIWYRVTVTSTATGSPVSTVAVLKTDISSQPGALLIPVAEGKPQALMNSANLNVTLTETTHSLAGTVVTGDYQDISDAINGILGKATDTPFTLHAKANMIMHCDIETSDINAIMPRFKLEKYYDQDITEHDIAVLQSNGNSVVFEPLGFLPKVRRTNLNLRAAGTVIDSQFEKKFRFAAPLGSPIISQSPINGPTNTTVADLSTAVRIRSNALAIKALLWVESILKQCDGIPAYSPLIGAEIVIPTYLPKTLDLGATVVSLGSMNAVQNVCGQLVGAVTNLVNELILKSQYAIAVEGKTKNPNNFEVILLTDPHVSTFLWVSGDERTLGNGMKYIFTKSNDHRIRDKIYVSFRLTNRDGEIDPLNFGTCLVSPSIVLDLQLHRNDTTFKRLSVIPRIGYFPTLPVLGVIEISGMREFFVN